MDKEQLYADFIDELYSVLPAYRIERYRSIDPSRLEVIVGSAGVRQPDAIIRMILKGSASSSSVRQLLSAIDPSLTMISDALQSLIVNDVAANLSISIAKTTSSLTMTNYALDLIKAIRSGKRIPIRSRMSGIPIGTVNDVAEYNRSRRSGNASDANKTTKNSQLSKDKSRNSTNSRREVHDAFDVFDS